MKKNQTVKNLLMVFVLIATGICTYAQDDIKKVKLHAYKQIEDEVGYSQAVKVGNTLYISGCTSSDTSMYLQIKSVMENIKATLAKYGATLQNVVKETVYTTNLDEFIANKEIHKAFYQNDYPASTWVEVKRLYLPQFRVEIEVIAQLK